MRREPTVPPRHADGTGLRGAFAWSTAGHLCVLSLLIGLGRSAPIPAISTIGPVEVQVLDHKPPGTVALTTARQAEGTGAAEKAPRSHKRSVERIHSTSDAANPSSPTATKAAPNPQVAAPNSEHTPPTRGIQADGDLAVPARGVTSATSTGSGQANSPEAVSGGHSTGLIPGNPRWESLRAAIQRRMVYPDIARRMGWQGKVIVMFVLHEDGQVRDLRVRTSSGFNALDTSALQAVERAAPLPMSGESVQIVIPVVFALRQGGRSS